MLGINLFVTMLFLRFQQLLILFVRVLEDPTLFGKIVAEVAVLGGFAALVTVLVNIGKFIGWIKDGDATKWVAGLNLVGIIALYVTRLFLPTFDVVGIDKTMLEVATAATFVLSYLGTLGISKLSHIALRGVPVVGKSYSYDKAKTASLESKV